MMKFTAAATALLLGAAAMAPAQAATVFTDRTAFESAVTVTDTEDFGAVTARAPGDPLTLDGVTYSTSTAAGLFFSEAAFGLSGGFIAAENSGFIIIDMSGVTAFGLDVSDLFSGVQTFTWRAFDASATQIATGTFERNNAFGFFGLTTEGEFITSFELEADGDYEAIDNLVFGTATGAEVPTPAALPLLVAGLAGLGALRRTPRKAG